MSEHITVGTCGNSSEAVAPAVCSQWAYPGSILNDPNKLFVRKETNGTFTESFLKFRPMVLAKKQWTGKRVVGRMRIKQIHKLRTVSVAAPDQSTNR